MDVRGHNHGPPSRTGGNNSLTGSIPPQLGNMRNVYMDVRGNNLTGRIPRELINLYNGSDNRRSMHNPRLHVHGNRLEGDIPWELCRELPRWGYWGMHPNDDGVQQNGVRLKCEEEGTDPDPGSNRPPTAAGALPAVTLAVGGTETVDVSQAFVDPDDDPLTWAVSSSSAPAVASAAGSRVTVTAVGAGVATVTVTATDPGGLSAAQSFSVTVSDRPSSFTDDPIQPGVTPVRAVHFTELRTRIDGLRAAAELGRFPWTDPVLTAGVTRVRLVHLLELREALAAAYATAGRPAPVWTDASPAAGATPIRAAHLMELRAAVTALSESARPCGRSATVALEVPLARARLCGSRLALRCRRVGRRSFRFSPRGCAGTPGVR